MEDLEIVREFLIESNENLGHLDQELVQLEQRPEDAALLASIFRTFHTIKGTCSFLGFVQLERIAHITENLLTKIRNGGIELGAGEVSLVLEAVDVIRDHLQSIESTNKESSDPHDSLCARIKATAERSPAPSVTPVAAVSTEAAAAPAEAPANADGIAESTIRVDVVLLDKLMNLV